ncbi:MAG: alpha/beta fold hydrolase [Sinobacteraceae bacterium]|nr:alpha/beta fold hydrolase [Nevskiaceae bacterium]
MQGPSWEADGQDWPNRDCSRFVSAAGLRWHVQYAGTGPVCLLLHGTGASTHSFRDLLPQLAKSFTVIAPDLPGHGFTERPRELAGLSLPGMAAGVAALLDELRLSPALAVGHSAGAAILCRMCLDRRIEPGLLVSLNGALLPLPGFKHPSITPFIRPFVSSDWLSRWFAKRLEAPGEVERLLRATGSQLDARGLQLYARLVRAPAHAGAALAMMGVWDVRPLEREIASLATPLRLFVGANDRMILPGEALRVLRLLPQAELTQLPGLGHLAHEEQPALLAQLIIDAARERRIVPS